MKCAGRKSWDGDVGKGTGEVEEVTKLLLVTVLWNEDAENKILCIFVNF